MKPIRVNLRRVTQADFPRQNWGEWIREHVEAPDGDGRTIDTKYMSPRPCCIHCATWICAECWDWRRVGATRGVSQYCGRCGGRDGFFTATRHIRDHEPPPRVPFRVPNIKERTTMHIPEEAEILSADEPEALTEEEARERGFLPPKPVRKGDEKEAAEEEAERDILAEQVEVEPKIMPEVVTAATTIIREAYAQGASSKDNVILTIAEVQELCDLAMQYPKVDGDYIVLGPEAFATRDGGAVCWKGENYYKMGEINARNSLAEDPIIHEHTLNQRLQERRAYMRRDSMQWAVDIQKAILASGNQADRPLVDTAQAIYDWLNDDQK